MTPCVPGSLPRAGHPAEATEVANPRAGKTGIYVKSRLARTLTVMPLALAALLASGGTASAHNVPYTKYGTYSYNNCYTNGNVGVQYKSWHNFYCSQSLAGWDLWVQY